MPKDILIILLGAILGFIIRSMIARKDNERNPYIRSNVEPSGSLFENNNDDDESRQLPEALFAEVKNLNSQGKKVMAIKVLREGTGWSLKESKNFVEKL